MVPSEIRNDRIAQALMAGPDMDPTPWCVGCGAMKRENCDCGPIADNN